MRTRMSGGITGKAGDRLPMSIVCQGQAVRGRLTAGCWALNPEIEVRILTPEPVFRAVLLDCAWGSFTGRLTAGRLALTQQIGVRIPARDPYRGVAQPG